TNMAIAEGTVCRFTRVVGGGLEAMASEIAERRGIPLVDARALLANIDLMANLAPEPAPEPEPASEPEPVAAAAAAAEGGREEEPLVSFHDGFGEPPEPEAVETWALAQSQHAQEATPAPAAAPEDPADDRRSASQTGQIPDVDVRMVLHNGIREIVGEVRNSL